MRRAAPTDGHWPLDDPTVASQPGRKATAQPDEPKEPERRRRRRRRRQWTKAAPRRGSALVLELEPGRPKTRPKKKLGRHTPNKKKTN